MAIQFNANQFLRRQAGDGDIETLMARGIIGSGTPYPILREDFIHRTHDEFNELKGLPIEINREAVTQDEYERFMSGETLGASTGAMSRDNYGIKWRIWAGGRPTAEQMEAAAWEEA